MRRTTGSSRSGRRKSRPLLRGPKIGAGNPSSPACPLQLGLTLELPAAKCASDSPGHVVRAPDHMPDVGEECVLYTREILRITQRHRTTIYRWIQSHTFPSKRLLGGRRRGWLRSDIERWLAGNQFEAEVTSQPSVRELKR